MKSFRASTTINAPPEAVWALLTDGAAYPDWNTTVERLEGRVAPGETIKVVAKLNSGRAFPVKVTTFDAPRKMVWTGGMPLGLFKGQRTFTLTPAGGDVEFTMDEVFSGLMSPLIGRSIPDMQPAFQEFAACLKAKAEGVTTPAST
jgi:uncharacterized protein YndB with AHSA1/START domain